MRSLGKVKDRMEERREHKDRGDERSMEERKGQQRERRASGRERAEERTGREVIAINAEFNTTMSALPA